MVQQGSGKIANVAAALAFVASPGLTVYCTTKAAVAQLTRALEESYVRNIPMGRVGVPEDLVGALHFLASPASDFVTGQTIVVGGGFTAR
jgi:NAD(P)-dependent dehydrogenase (short-subunit alcohol dehydrogenase family)